MNGLGSVYARYRRSTISAAALFLLCTPLGAAAQQIQVTLDPSQTKIEWTLGDVLHTVHGTFKLKAGQISFDPITGNASGELVVDASSGDSGNHLRDGKMKKEILETQRYPEITFVARRILGKVAAQGISTVQVQGVFHIHGVDHDLTLSVPLQTSGSEVQAATNFVVPYQAWGMKNPSTLFLRVDDKVQISISAVGKLTSAGLTQAGH